MSTTPTAAEGNGPRPRRARRCAAATGRTILVVDDQAETLESVRMLLEREGHRVLTADCGSRALALLDAEPVHVLLVDYFMPVMSGELLVRAVREKDTLVQIVLQTGYAGEKPPREMLQRLAIQGYHDKADGPDRLLLWVDVALKSWEQLAQLHAADQMKTELLASVSHEFRTPLNIIIGYTDLLQDGTFGPSTPEASAVCQKVLANATYLSELVAHFLDLSRIEAGVMPLATEPVDLERFLGDIADAFGMLTAAGPVRFVTEIPADLPAVLAEPAKLRVVLQNLLSNALKFTREGEIRLVAEALGEDRVAIRVHDTGPGISPEHREAIFDVFHQLQPHDGERKGVGLGLALARRFARLMNGDVTVESREAPGSTFSVVLPAMATRAATRGAA
ncbi:MAG: hybrid sensor histidine kinase/response regulator [Candidatus Binatia bacterium]